MDSIGFWASLIIANIWMVGAFVLDDEIPHGFYYVVYMVWIFIAIVGMFGTST